MKERITVDQARALSLAAQPQCSESDLTGWCDAIDALIEEKASAGGYSIHLDGFYGSHPTAKPFEADILAVFARRGFAIGASTQDVVAIICWHPIYPPA